MSYEKYFGENKGYVSAAAFYKDLRSYIFQQSLPYDFSKFIAQLPPGELVTTNIGQFTAPYNGEGGSLQGLELTASLPLDLFWEAAEGFGVVASAGFFDSNISIAVPENASSVGPDEIPLPGLSDEVYNLTVYYARAGFEAGRTDFGELVEAQRGLLDTELAVEASRVELARRRAELDRAEGRLAGIEW